MKTRSIESKQNPRLKQLRRALTHPAQRPGELAGIEGPNLVEEALHAGLRVDSIFVADGHEALLEPLPLDPETEVLLLDRALLNSALTTEAPQPIAALVEPPFFGWEDLLPAGKTPLLLVLAGVQDPGNLGTILRSAEAFGATGVVALPGTVSPWNTKSIRASAGSFFRLPFLTCSVVECFAKLNAAGVHIWTTDVREAQPAPAADLAQPTAILIGNEGNGVPAAIAARAHAALTIPCPGPVESLNAAVAASILLYEASCQRATGKKKGAR
ncbi:TrmH family RNA methyltransferase [Telmatobacter bradus]|uniref:TrmH family RNA methyltransferase n=1 Tax=Telmatobacter bradus TaxID=474953 RepID=UPI003B439DD8